MRDIEANASLWHGILLFQL